MACSQAERKPSQERNNPCSAFPGFIRDICGTIKKIAFQRVPEESVGEEMHGDVPLESRGVVGHGRSSNPPVPGPLPQRHRRHETNSFRGAGEQTVAMVS